MDRTTNCKKSFRNHTSEDCVDEDHDQHDGHKEFESGGITVTRDTHHKPGSGLEKKAHVEDAA